jgi:hypothetical protein
MLPVLQKEGAMSFSASKLKFLLDENVKKALLSFLKSKEYDVVFKPKGLSNGKLASFSKSSKEYLLLMTKILLNLPEMKYSLLFG